LSGVTIANLNPAVGIELGITSGGEEAVVVTNIAGRSSASRFVSVGDIILELNGKEIEDVGDIEKALKRANGQGYSLVINSNGRIQQISVR